MAGPCRWVWIGDRPLREIGTIAEEKAARLFEDHLLTLGISTKLDKIPDGFRIWVLREDKLDEARAALDVYRANPAAPEFQSAPREARLIRRKAEQAEAEYRGNDRDVAAQWAAPFHRRVPLTAALLVICFVVAFLTDLGEKRSGLQSWMTLSTLSLAPDGRVVDHGFREIARGEVWRLVTPIFLHYGMFHLVFNMLALIGLGERVESRKGWRKMAVIIAVAAVLGNVGQFFEGGGQFGGMSGVLFALAGYLWAKGHADPEDGLSLQPNTAFLMVAWFLFGILNKVDPNPAGPDASDAQVSFANVCHGAGLAVGIVFGLLRF